MKRYFLTIDWCNRGERGIFCSPDGKCFSQEKQHTAEEMYAILGAFDLILSPESQLLSEKELAEYHIWKPLAEYTNHYGVALK
jgi:hypothetical protein